MEAANKGASMVQVEMYDERTKARLQMQGRSIGMGITLPFETGLNPYVTPELAFEYHCERRRLQTQRLPPHTKPGAAPPTRKTDRREASNPQSWPPHTHQTLRLRVPFTDVCCACALVDPARSAAQTSSRASSGWPSSCRWGAALGQSLVAVTCSPVARSSH
eukprot:7310352-Prymnesium_polylepis.1